MRLVDPLLTRKGLGLARIVLVNSATEVFDSQGESAVFTGVAESLAAEGIWAVGSTAVRRFIGKSIKITLPRPQEVLTDPRQYGGEISYLVRGQLRRLPSNHQIWLLTQDERNGRVWPQGFHPVQFDRAKGEWWGRVIDGKLRRTQIIAVVAPPTSSDFFCYFQNNGRATNYAPLMHIPAECRNIDVVQAVVP